MLYLGVDIGGTSVKVGVVDPNGKILSRVSYVAEPHTKQEDFIKELGLTIKEHLEKNGYSPKDFQGAGIGCAGAINSRTGCCDYSNNLDWHFLNVVSILQGIIGIPCRIANDANVAILGEAKFGCGKKYHNLVLLTLGTGVGGGLFLNDQLFEGNDGKGAELGHMTISAPKVEQCTCGRSGCFEAYASATALIRDTKRAMEEDRSSILWYLVGGDISKVEGKTVFDAMDKGDATARKVVGQYIVYLGEGIMNFCNIFRPDAIILSGGVSRQGEKLTKPLLDYIKERHYGFQCAPAVDILVAELGADTGIIGAAALCM